jgi:hypothetical protein
MAKNQFVTTDVLADETAVAFALTSLSFNRISSSYNSMYKTSGFPKNGDTIRVPVIEGFRSTNALQFNPQPIVTREIPLTISDNSGVDMTMGMFPATLFADTADMARAGRYGEMAGKTVAAAADTAVIRKLALNGNNNIIVGATGTRDLNKAIHAAKTSLTYAQIPEGSTSDDLTLLLSPNMSYDVVEEMSTIFNPTQSIGDSYASGNTAPKIYGLPVFESQRLGTFTAGTGSLAGAAFTDGSNQVTVTSAANIKVGDIINLGVSGVEYYSKTANGVEAQRKVVAISGNILTLSDIVAWTGGQQNVAEQPGAVSFALTAGTTYDLAIAFHRDAAAFVTVDMAVPNNGGNTYGSRSGGEATGLATFAFMDWYTPLKSHIACCGAVWGAGVLRPQFITTIMKAQA